MQYLIRLRDWWLSQYRNTSRLGKVAMILVPLLFACCGLMMCSVLIAPPAADPTPTAELAERAATVDVTAAAPTQTQPPPTATEEATATNTPTNTARPTARPSSTARPTNTSRPTAAPTATTEPAAPAAPTMGAATALFATAAAQPATAALPTSAPPLAVAPPTAAPTQPPPLPTDLPVATATLPPVAAPGDVFISSVFYNGVVEQVESDEHAVITNRGAAVVNLNGWRLNAGEPDQNFYFPSFDLQPGQSCRVYTNEAHPESCGFSFGIGSAIWRNSGDCGMLHDATGAEVSRYCW